MQLWSLGFLLEIYGNFARLRCSAGQTWDTALKTNWVLKEKVIDAIEDAFDGPASIYRNLGTNNKYWEPKLKSREGVKKKTAEKIALLFVRRLLEIYDHTFTGTGLDTKKAMKYYKQFEEAVRTENVSTMIEELKVETDAAASPTPAPKGNADSTIPRIGGAAA